MNSCEESGGSPLLWNPVLTKGTAFTEEERRSKGLSGLLPPTSESMEDQVKRVKWQICQLPNDLEKYSFLTVLSATNQRLYYKVLFENLAELLPVVYTPTVGEGCQKFSRLYLKPAGMYFSAFRHRGQFREMLDNWPANDVDIIVVTDGGRILGLGDLGINGMGISCGKIALYIAAAGFHPERAMPVCLDCGTDNLELRDDAFYLGERKPRIHGAEHLAVVEEFCLAVKSKWPNCLIQFEDFKTEPAFEILQSLRDRVLCFNDDIQGTAAVVSAGFLNGIRIQKTSMNEVRVVFVGAGSSACGVAHMLAGMLQSEGGLSKEAAYGAIYLVDTKGLITNTRTDVLPEHKRPFVRTDGVPDLIDLVEIIHHIRPHALFGLTGGGQKFTKEVVEELCTHCDRPLIFPLSNPTSQAEVSAIDAYEWSRGMCLFAAGSPFEPVEYGGRTFVPGQANNVFIFPGLGFGAVAIKASKVNDEMLKASAKQLASSVTVDELEQGKLYPDVKTLRTVSIGVAKEVARTAVATSVAVLERPIRNYATFIISKLANTDY
eukprot:g7171.t1